MALRAGSAFYGRSVRTSPGYDSLQPQPAPVDGILAQARPSYRCWFGYYVTYPKDAARLRKAMAARRQKLIG